MTYTILFSYVHVYGVHVLPAADVHDAGTGSHLVLLLTEQQPQHDALNQVTIRLVTQW